MQLKLTSTDSGETLCSEYKTYDTYHYGKYEVRMKAAKNIGVVSSFFTYTGPAFGTAWDEVDIEFLGKDTTKVQLNYFTDGIGGHEKLVELGFDASEDFHDYAFEWRADSIKWYIDGQLVHTATDNLPVTPGKIMMNLWNGTGVDDWLGHYDGGSPITAEYEWMKFTPYEAEAPSATHT
jgi:beta-glucanase (GH16 family)